MKLLTCLHKAFMVRAGKHLPALLNSAFGNTLLETPYTVMQLSNDATLCDSEAQKFRTAVSLSAHTWEMSC